VKSLPTKSGELTRFCKFTFAAARSVEDEAIWKSIFRMFYEHHHEIIDGAGGGSTSE
jgi:hypothetical protein